LSAGQHLDVGGGGRLIPPAFTERRYKKCETVQLHAETGIVPMISVTEQLKGFAFEAVR
jgi:hypothetical protein